MALLKDKDKEFLAQEFSKLTGLVKLIYFTQEHECPYCEVTSQIVHEIAGLSPKIAVSVYDFVADKETAEQYRVDKIPAIAVVGAKDYGIRFYGVPSGYEFTSLIESIKDASAGTTSLSPATKEALAKLDKPVHIQVYSTPT
jgi:glutaredoxin-like protein